MSVYSIRFSGELRLVSDEIWQGETPEEAAVRILGPIGVIVEYFDDVAKPDGEQQALAWRRNPACVERWPKCSDGEYNPACCRFPKACSCDEPVGEQP